MRVTTKGQVTIPRDVREALGISPETEVEFVEEKGRFYIVKTDEPIVTKKFNKLRWIASVNMTTYEIIQLTRKA
jgi:AbrB family looped-hinge helix DNA binding protein